ncbi:MAG: FMN-binding protein [Deltaproteobacteria bacterium]|nr:FMN-binding protein [Deltaproteobacteria bacterium]
MTGSPHPTAQKAPPAWVMYRALVGVAIVCSLLIVTVYELTAPVIAANKAEALERAIFDVVPGAESSKSFTVTDSGFEPKTDSAAGPVVHAGFDGSGKLVGLAIEAQGMGYQDVVRILYGYSPREQAVIGLVVLESRETPGLGDKVETDPTYRKNFERLDVSVNADGSALAHPIEAVKPGKKQSPWQIDTITGATITSKAIADMIRDSSAEMIPHIRKHQAALTGATE